MRLFVAVELDESLKGKIGKITGEMKAEDIDVKFTENENLHFTLKFLGEVGEDSVPEINRKIAEALKGVKPFKISLEGLGYFGSHNFIKVIWTGVKLGKEKLAELSGKMKVLDYIRPDDFEPNPHLTLGRPKSGKNKELILQEIERLRDVKIGEMEVKEVKLKQSVLGREGPAYSDVEVFRLGEVA